MLAAFATRIPGALISPGGRNGRLSILIFHRVLPWQDGFLDEDPVVDTFRWQMKLLAEHFTVLSLPEAFQRMTEGTLPARAACITFDDGYADNVEVALPVLQEFGLVATFFIAAGFLDGGCMWNDIVCSCIRETTLEYIDLTEFGLTPLQLDHLQARLEAVRYIRSHIKHFPLSERQRVIDVLVEKTGTQVPTDLMMTSRQLRTLAKSGMEIGGHTVSHPILKSLSIEEADKEIKSGKEQIEAIIQSPLDYFAYPNGKPGKDYESVHVKLLHKAGFKGAVSTAHGISSRETDCYQLPRFTPWDRTPMRFLARLFINCLNTNTEVAR